MAIIEELHKNDFGTLLKVLVNNTDASGNTAADDISGFGTTQFILKKPDGTKLTKTATFTTDGTDGYLQYTLADGDLDVAGDWELQVNLVNGSTSQYRSDTVKFRVHDIL